MAKIKKYSSGTEVEGDYESSDDAKALAAAEAREKADYEKSIAPKAEAPKTMSFGSAFKEARGRGDKTFEWNGKKYTTEMASEKKPTRSPGANMTAIEPPRTRLLEKGKRLEAVREARRREKSGMQGLERSNPMGDAYKKGGSVSSASKRADGIAMRGKTKGRYI